MPEGSHLDRAAIEASQLEQLRSLLAELIPANRFQTAKLQAVGAGFDVASLEDFVTRFPFTTKAELVANQLAHPPYGTNLTHPLRQYTRLHQTSGTTGTPLRWLDTPESWERMVQSWREILETAGVVAGDRVMFAFSFGPYLGFWLAFESAVQLGCLCLPGGGMSSVARLRVMRDNQTRVLCCTPTYAIRLAEVAATEQVPTDSLGVRVIIVAGEPGGSIPATRARLESLWPGARVFDHHGMTEVGPVTHECPTQPGRLHVLESAYFAEVIDPATSQPATKGELVLTTLGRIGSPLLRYRTGDLVQRAPAPCVCGRHELTLEGGILGRVDDMVIVRGVNVHPAAVEDVIRQFNDVMEYCVHVTRTKTMTELRLTIEPSSLCRDIPALVGLIEKAFETAFQLRVPIRIMPPGSMPRFEMKAHRWVNG